MADYWDMYDIKCIWIIYAYPLFDNVFPYSYKIYYLSFGLDFYHSMTETLNNSTQAKQLTIKQLKVKYLKGKSTYGAGWN